MIHKAGEKWIEKLSSQITNIGNPGPFAQEVKLLACLADGDPEGGVSMHRPLVQGQALEARGAHNIQLLYSFSV